MFAVNEHFKHVFKQQHKDKKLRFADYYLAGGLGGVANSIISCPMEHIRIRMQV